MGTSSWLDKYKADLAAIVAKGSTTKVKSPYEIANLVASTPRLASEADLKDAAWNTYNPFQKVLFADNTQKILDVLSRGLYASASFVNEAQKQAYTGEDKGDTPNFWQLDKGKMFGAAIEGLEGQSKKTFSDVNTSWESHIKDPVQRERLANDTWGKGVASFFEDVLLDPTTFIGPGTVKSGIKGAKNVIAPNAKLPEIARNAVREVDPVKVAKEELETTGKTIVTPGVARSIGIPKTKIIETDSVVAKTIEDATEAANKFIAGSKAKWLEGLTTTGVERNPAAVRAALLAQRDTLTRGVESLRYSDDVKSKIPSIYKETTTTRPTVKSIEETVEVPGREVAESAKFNTVKRLILQEPERFGLTITKDGIKAGERTFPLSELNGMVNHLLPKVTPERLARYTVKLEGRSGLVHEIPAPLYLKALVTGKIPRGGPVGLKEFFVPKGSGRVPIKEYIAGKSAKYSEAAKPREEKVIKQLEAVLETVPDFTRLTAKELAIWKKSLNGILDPEDIKTLTAARSKAGFESKLEELFSKKVAKDYDSLDEIIAAVEKGSVSKEELNRVLALHGNAKSISGAQKFLNDLNIRIEKLNIPTAEELISSAAKGDKEAIKILEFTPVSLTNAEKEVVSRIVSHVVKKEFMDPKTWKYKTNKGTLRTSPTLGEGLGRNLKGFNKFSQYTLHSQIMREVSEMLKISEAARPAKITREQRMAYVYDRYMLLLKASEDTLMSRGISPIVGKGERGLPLSLHDVLSAMPRNVVEHRMMDRLRHIPPTNWLDAAGTLAYAVSRNVPIDAAIRDKVFRAIMQDIGNANTFAASVMKGISTGGKHKIMATSDIERVVDKFISAAPQFAAAVERNSARASIKYGQYVEALRKEVIDGLVKDITVNIGNSSEILKIVDDLDSYVTQAVRTVDEPVLEGAAEQVAAESITAVNNIIPVAEIQSALRSERLFINKDVNPGSAIIDDALKTVDELEMPKEYVADMFERLQLAQGVAFLRNIFPHIGNKSLRPFFLAHQSAAKAVSTKYAAMLGRIDKTYTKTEILEAWKNIQDGITAVDPATRIGAAHIELSQAMSTVFNLSPNRGIITLSGLNLKHINSKMSHFGIPEKYRFTGDTFEKALLSYKTWENVSDPLDLLSRVHTAVRSAQADKLLADTIAREFGSISATAERNVKLVNVDKSILGTLLQGQYFSKEIANQLRVLEISIEELMKPPSMNKLARLYDSAIHSYKAGLTIYVPAHHMRNMYGDIWLASMDGLFNPSYYKKSIEVLASRKTNYKDFNPDVFNIGTLGDGKPVVTLKFNGKPVALTSDNLYRLATSKGVLTDYTVIEDLAVGASDTTLMTSVSKQIEKISPFKGAVHSRVTKVAEYREHYVRMAHFIYALEQQGILRGKTLQEAIENAGYAASARVRKWHPDGSDYSSFERNQLRRVILFYSWIRKAIPLVLESAFTQPGRFMIYPKAMYNMAEANGIDLQGMSDPFPTDQLFPTWMHEEALGPQMGSTGGYFGIKQGVPGPDVLEQYFSSPLGTMGTLMSSVTPAIRLPWEIVMDQNTRTKSEIKDWPSWLLNQLPYGSRVNTMAGEPVGIPAKSNVGYEPQLDLPGGSTLDKKGITALNWLTGLGITDMSKPSYQKSAQLEMKNKK